MSVIICTKQRLGRMSQNFTGMADNRSLLSPFSILPGKKSALPSHTDKGRCKRLLGPHISTHSSLCIHKFHCYSFSYLPKPQARKLVIPDFQLCCHTLIRAVRTWLAAIVETIATPEHPPHILTFIQGMQALNDYDL